jgi:hypothetical protein
MVNGTGVFPGPKKENRDAWVDAGSGEEKENLTTGAVGEIW